MILGARVFKTGIAVTLALLISSWLHLTPPIIAGVASIFALQPTIYRSWRHILEQIQTNTLGAALALIAVQFFQNHPLAIGIICILAILICLQMKMEETIGLTLVTVIAIMEAPGHWTFAVSRFSLILIGILSAFVVNAVFLPPNPKEQFASKLYSVFSQLSLLLRTVISNEIKETVFQEEKQELERSIKGLADKYQLFEEELKKIKLKNRFSQIRMLVVYKQMLTSLQRGLDVLQATGEHYFQSGRTAETDELFDRHIEKVIHYHEYVLMKFQDKVKLDSTDHYSMEEDNEQFLESVHQLHASGEKGMYRLTVVASVIFDYAYQVNRLERMVEHWRKGGDS